MDLCSVKMPTISTFSSFLAGSAGNLASGA
jgi:hypothetical protein